MMIYIALINEYPRVKSYLHPNASIIHSKDFENAIVKIQSGCENKLTRIEASTVSMYLIDPQQEEQNNSDNDINDEEDFALSVMQKANEASKKRRQSIIKSKYKHLNHLTPTSNVVERLFSTAKSIMQDNRKRMTPYHLECLLFLRCNYFLWDATTIDEMLKVGDVRDASSCSSTSS